MNVNQWLWNASISYQMLRDKSLTLSLKGYDLLNQRASISNSPNAQYTDNVSVNTLSRYFMATLSWKFNTFGKGKEPRGMGHGGFGGPGGRPGPPPGGFGGGGRGPR